MSKRGISLFQPIIRYPKNPILTPRQVNKSWTSPKLKVITCHNAGVVKHNERYIMFFRSHLRSGISIIGLAQAKKPEGPWSVSPKPAIIPEKQYERGGVEDPRITKIGDEYAITYSAYDSAIKDKVRVSLITTKDFKSFQRHGPIFDKDARNTVIFPEKVKGKYYALFRINPEYKKTPGITYTGKEYTRILLGTTSDYKSGKWEIQKKPIIKSGHGPSSIQDKIGPGAPLIKTSKGYLNIFHGVRQTMAGNPYVLSVALHDLKDPRKVKMSNIPILFPTPADCKIPESEYRHVDQIVFTCAAIREKDGTILIFYGGNDTVMNLAYSHEKTLIKLCEQFPQDTLTGKALYEQFQ